MKDVRKPLEDIIEVLEHECAEEVIELSRGHEVTAKVIDRQAVAEVLRFDDDPHGEPNFMQRVIESIEFFRVESSQTGGSE